MAWKKKLTPKQKADYLDEEKSVNYLSPMITEMVKATVKGTEQRLTRLLFKVAV